MHPVFRLLRMHHWSKNLLVYAGIFFSGRFDLILTATLIFVAFCSLTSAVYVFNDIHDIQSDKKHPTKKHRPLASGQIDLRTAWIIWGVLLLITAGIAFFIPRIAALILLIYLLLNIGYTLSWKKIVIVEIFIIALGFMLRAFAGTTGLNLKESPWFIATIISLSLFLVFTKRAYEKSLDPTSQRSSVQLYPEGFLWNSTLLCMIVTICFYSLYVIETKEGVLSVLTILFVLYGFLRYIFLFDAKLVSGDPVIDFFRDKALFINTVLWAVVFLLSAYV